jgi:hypothetical protein
MEDGNHWIAGRETYLVESAGMKLSFYYSLNYDVGAWLRDSSPHAIQSRAILQPIVNA